MKTIVRNDNNVSLYLLPNDTVITQDLNKTVFTKDSLVYHVADCNTSNTTVYENVTSPPSWSGWKYLYTEENGWDLNEDWPPAEPELPTE